MEIADGQKWELSGNYLKRQWTASANGEPILEISQKLAAMVDTLALDMSPGVQPVEALALLWAVDHFVENHN